MSYFLFLDDLRKPETIKFSYQYDHYEKIWVKNYEEFSKIIKDKGLPIVVSFDFDLCVDHYKAGERSRFTNLSQYKYTNIKNGGDCARYLISYCQQNKTKLPKWFIHSQNPLGRDEISSLLKSFEKSLEINK